jgi:MFS superfamily sulfate permease-like transporter
MQELPPIVIIRLRTMTAIDATGLFALEEIAKQLPATKRTLIPCGAREQPTKMILRENLKKSWAARISAPTLTKRCCVRQPTSEDARHSIKPLGCLAGGAFILQHGTDLFP